VEKAHGRRRSRVVLRVYLPGAFIGSLNKRATEQDSGREPPKVQSDRSRWNVTHQFTQLLDDLNVQAIPVTTTWPGRRGCEMYRRLGNLSSFGGIIDRMLESGSWGLT